MQNRGRIQGQMRRWEDEQLFEEDVRAVLSMMRPHRNESLLGWEEYRTGGRDFRVTISWDPDFQRGAAGTDVWEVPHLSRVLETIMIGTVKNQDELTAEQEFALYRGVVHDLYRRALELRQCMDE